MKRIYNSLSTFSPVGKAYSPYYGDIVLSHYADSGTGYDTYMTLFTNMQYIMYNGVNVRSFLRITESLVSDYVENITIEADTNRYIVEYTLNHESEIDNRIKRLFAWQYIIKQTYKLFVLQERVT